MGVSMEQEQQGEVQTPPNPEVILLPPGPITRLVEGESGTIYRSVLIEDPAHNRLTDCLISA